MRAWLVAAVFVVGLAGLARAEGYPELSCFSGPTRADNYYQNWDFTNNCPFEVTVHFSHVAPSLGANNPNAVHFAFACKKTRFQTVKSATVVWGKATYTAKAGTCIDGKAVVAKDPPPDKPLATTGPGGAGGGAGEPPKAKSKFGDLKKEQEQRNAGAAEANANANAAIDAGQVVAEEELKEKARALDARNAAAAAAAQNARDAAKAPASGFDVGLCDKVEYDHYGEDNKTQLLCWRYNYQPKHSDPYATCDANGIDYNGVLAIYCKLGN